MKGGNPIEEGPETEKVAWVNIHHLPLNMVPNRRKQIKNYLQKKNHVVKQSITVSPIIRTLLKGYLKLFR
ncbi:hypothetical protein AAHB53_01635 [Niallia circulans]